MTDFAVCSDLNNWHRVARAADTAQLAVSKQHGVDEGSADTGATHGLLEAMHLVRPRQKGRVPGDGSAYKMPKPAVLLFCYNRCHSVLDASCVCEGT